MTKFEEALPRAKPAQYYTSWDEDDGDYVTYYVCWSCGRNNHIYGYDGTGDILEMCRCGEINRLLAPYNYVEDSFDYFESKL